MTFRARWARLILRGGDARAGALDRERGASTVEFAILFPVIVALLFLGPQLALWYTGQFAAEKAAVIAAREASVANAAPGDGKAAAERVLAESGSGTIESWQVSETKSATTVTITITVTVVRTVPLPGFEPTATVTVTRPIERFTTAGSP